MTHSGCRRARWDQVLVLQIPHEPPDSAPTTSPILRRRLGTITVRQMVAKESIDMPGAQALEGNALVSQPPPEVLGHLNAAPTSRARVTAPLQVGPEALENDVKMAGNDPETDRAGRDRSPARGGIGKTVNFHGFRHPSPYSPLQTNTNLNSSREGSRAASFHSHHPRITAPATNFQGFTHA